MRNSNIFICIAFCLIIVTSSVPDAISQDKQPGNTFTHAQFEAKYERLRISTQRVARFKSRGSLNNAIKEARESIKIAEEEFGATSTLVLNPVFTLVELLGKKRQYEEAQEFLKKIYMIIDKSDDENEISTVYAIGYRMRISRLYIEWNMFDKAESTLLKALDIINTSLLRLSRNPRVRYTSDYYGGYIKSINELLDEVHEFQEINRFKDKEGNKE